MIGARFVPAAVDALVYLLVVRLIWYMPFFLFTRLGFFRRRRFRLRRRRLRLGFFRRRRLFDFLGFYLFVEHVLVPMKPAWVVRTAKVAFAHGYILVTLLIQKFMLSLTLFHL